jgi:alpha-tubulin suppressor-like RCC1 family protein
MFPRKLFTLSTKRVGEFAPGPFHTLALTYDGFIYAFGNSKEGKLGINLNE